MGDSFRSPLRDARATARLSQLALALRLGVSQRHVSFVESGRARPSRELLVRWLEALGTPLALRNAILVQAGFAPAYGDARLGDPELATARGAMRRLLDTHDPMPAFVLDAEWNVRDANRGAHWLIGVLVPWATSRPGDAAMNMLDLLAHPDGLTARMLNLPEVAPTLRAHLRVEAALHPALAARVRAVEATLASSLGPSVTARAAGPTLGPPGTPVLTTQFRSPYGPLAFFTMLTTFGTPQDITLSSLRIEHLFAADASTRAVLEAHVGADTRAVAGPTAAG